MNADCRGRHQQGQRQAGRQNRGPERALGHRSPAADAHWNRQQGQFAAHHDEQPQPETPS